jgi:hypothetical protein
MNLISRRELFRDNVDSIRHSSPSTPLRVVNLHTISHVTRGDNETVDIQLKGRKEVLPVSRSYLHLFRQDVTGRTPRRSRPLRSCLSKGAGSLSIW